MDYSPECVEGKFSEVELPLYGVLRSSPPLAPLPGQGIHRGVPVLYHDAMKITPTPHAHRRMHERRVTVADIRNVLNSRPKMHFSLNKRVHTGRARDGRRLQVMYTEAKAGEVRIVSVAAP